MFRRNCNLLPHAEYIMAKYRHDLTMGKRQPFLLDGGLEITLVFLDGIDLPCFAPYPLIAETSGRMKALMPEV
jgi:homocysteine S-methyltransferase